MDSTRQKTKLSLVSKITNWMTKLCVIPVKMDRKHVHAEFSFFSCRTLFFVFVFLFASIMIIGIFIPLFMGQYKDFVSVLFLENDPINLISILLFFSLLYLISPLSVLMLASSFPNLTELSMHPSLKCPKNWLNVLAMQCSFLLGSFLVLIGMYLGTVEKMDKASVSHFIAFFVLPFLSLVFTQLYWFTSVFLASVWVSKFIDLCTNINHNDPIPWSKKCLFTYNSLEKHLGSYFFLFFSSSQVLWIFTLYIGVTGSFSDFRLSTTICFAAGFAILSLSILVNILGFSGLLEDAHQSVQGLVKTLEIQSLLIDDRKAMLQLSYHIKDIEKAKPLTGRGLFQIDRSIFTGMMSVAFTYIIILVQFKLSFDD